jgi:hypothetical protein
LGNTGGAIYSRRKAPVRKGSATDSYAMAHKPN